MAYKNNRDYRKIAFSNEVINKVRNLEIGDKFMLPAFPQARVVENKSQSACCCNICIMYGYEDYTSAQCPLLKACTARYRKDHKSVRFDPINVIEIK